MCWRLDREQTAIRTSVSQEKSKEQTALTKVLLTLLIHFKELLVHSGTTHQLSLLMNGSLFSLQSHYSVQKSAAALGLGRRSVVMVACDERWVCPCVFAQVCA